MARSTATTVDEYLQSLPDASRAELSPCNGLSLGHAGLAAQKSYHAFHPMCVYGNGAGVRQLQDGFAQAGKKLDMGTACVRFRRADDLALDAIAASIASLSVDDYISMHERARAVSRAP